MAAAPQHDRDETQLQAIMAAAGLDSNDERVTALLPVWRVMQAAAARLRELDLAELEPATMFALPLPE